MMNCAERIFLSVVQRKTLDVIILLILRLHFNRDTAESKIINVIMLMKIKKYSNCDKDKS